MTNEISGHAFVTSQGSPLTRFRRAIRSQSILMAELSAREAGRLPLEDALALVALYRAAAADVNRAERELAEARARFRATIAEVHASGVTLTAIGHELGVSRQRVYAMLRHS